MQEHPIIRSMDVYGELVRKASAGSRRTTLGGGRSILLVTVPSRENIAWRRPIRRWEGMVMRKRESGLKAVLTELGGVAPQTPQGFSLGPKACQGEKKQGGPKTAPLSRFRSWTALGLLLSRALSSGQARQV